MSIDQKIHAPDILLVCEALDRGNSLEEVANFLIPAYANTFQSYTLGVHYFESIAKYGTSNEY
ncbi:hypothetical protein [Nostoc sp.]|uniref:hypothetical protein n=1 Tax=Nostoc sp. TaxID=1180 RepID=UPI002FF61FF7